LIVFACCQGAYCLSFRQEAARAKLKSLGVEFTPQAFVESAGDKRRSSIVRTFLDAGMDPNVRGKSGLTALMSASFDGNIAALDMLLKQGARIGLTDDEGRAALHWAARGPFGLECVVALLDHGADPNIATPEGTTPIMESALVAFAVDLAPEFGITSVKTVRVLLDRGADLNAKTKHGVTVLIRAAIGGNPATVKLLLDHGADVKARDSNGNSARDYAVLLHHQEIARMIAEAGG
jgi:ankyrin repeat protein